MATISGAELCVVLPVYNEEASIGRVIAEWMDTLRTLGESFIILVIDDGSKDATARILDDLAGSIGELRVAHRANVGHGKSCLFGYRLAMELGARWILQIDSDGQCDPKYFAQVWESRREFQFVFGQRVRRDDGWLRLVCSRLLSTLILLATGRWVRDSNVPYRLMCSETLRPLLDQVPEGVSLVNVFLSYLICNRTEVGWVPIRFRQRFGGQTATKLPALARQARLVYAQLRAYRREGKAPVG